MTRLAQQSTSDSTSRHESPERVPSHGAWSIAAAAICAGFLIALAWLDERAFPLTWVGLTLLFAVTVRQPAYMAFRIWLLGGIVILATGFYWMPAVAAQTLRVSIWSGVVVGLLVIAWDAFRFAIFGFLAARLINEKTATENGRSSVKSIAGKALVWPIVWVALEWGWPHIFPWRFGHSQIGFLPLCQIAEGTGVYGVSFLLLWGAASSAYALRACIISRESTHRRASFYNAAACSLVLISVTSWGSWRIREVKALADDRPKLSVALIQPGSDRDNRLAKLREESFAVADQVKLVVWPESTIDDFSHALQSFQSKDDVLQHARYISSDPQPCPGLPRPLLCNGGSFETGAKETGPYFNTAYLIDADQKILGRYHKRMLLPWGEYDVGQRYIPGLRTVLGDEGGGLIPGDSASPLIMPDGTRLGVLICYEDLIDQAVRDSAAEGAEILLNLNNLSGFGETSAVPGHQQLARFRAIENRRALLRCGIVGSTAVISPTGRVVQQAPLYRPATLVTSVPLLERTTLYTRWGDVFAKACLVLAGLLLVCRAVPSRRGRNSRPGALGRAANGDLRTSRDES